MEQIVYVVFDTELEKVVGVFSNPEAADDCENAAPGRYTEPMDLLDSYKEEDDPRVLDDLDINAPDGEKICESYDDEELYNYDDNDEDPYGD